MATISYDYIYNIVGDALGAVNNTASSSVALTGLTTGETYEIQVRQRQDEAGVIYYSTLSSDTFVAVTPPIVVNLATIVHTPVLNSVSPISPVVVNLGLINPTPLINEVRSYQVYKLRVKEVGGATTYIDNIIGNSSAITGLTESANYEVAVRVMDNAIDHNGVTYFTTYSNTISFLSEYRPPVLINLNTITSTTSVHSLTVFDRVLKILNLQTNNDADDFVVTGTIEPDIATISITVDGVEMAVVHDGSFFTGTLSQVPLLISTGEELDAPVQLYAGNTLLEVG